MNIRKYRIDAYDFGLELVCDLCGHTQTESIVANAHPLVEQKVRIALMKKWAMHVCNPRNLAKRSKKHDDESRQVSNVVASSCETSVSQSFVS